MKSKGNSLKILRGPLLHLMLCLSPVWALSQTLDQSCTTITDAINFSTDCNNGGESCEIGQVFTAGITGNLSSIKMSTSSGNSSSANFNFYIYSGSTVAGGTLIYSGTSSTPSAASTEFTMTISPAVSITSGLVYTVRLENTSGYSVIAANNSGGACNSGGTAYAKANGTVVYPGYLDFYFKTYVTVAPTISTSGTLSAFTSCAGTESAAQSFSVSGSNLSANLVVTPPTGFEVSTSAGSGYGSSVTLGSGTVSSTTIYVRLTNSASGTPSGNIACTSTGATTQNVAVSGTVNALPADPGNPTSNSPQCASVGVTLTASGSAPGGETWYWQTSANGTSTTNNASLTYNATATGTYYIRSRNNTSLCWSSGAGSLAVTVNANPTASIAVTETSGTANNDGNLCSGANATLDASGSSAGSGTISGYLWSTAATSSSISVNSAASYTVTVTNSNGCSTTSSGSNISVNANPTASIAVTETSGTANNDGILCSGANATLDASGSTAGSGTISGYLWSTAATSSSISVNSAASYTVTVTNTNGCSTTSSGSSISVNANPTASIAVTETSGTANNDGILCSGASATLDATGSTAGSGTVSGYLWSTAATSSSINVNSAASYTVTVTNTNACSTTSSGSSISVNANPTASIAVTETSGTANNDGILCSGASATLDASGSTAGSGTVSAYLWSTAATSSSISVNSAASYTVTVTNTNACSTTSSGSSISVNANPTASIAVTETSGTANNDGILCSGASATLDASGSTAGSGTVSAYLWSTAATSSSISVNSAASYTVQVTNTNGCSTTSSGSSISVNANPTASIAVTETSGTANNDGILCSGASATLDASGSTAGSGTVSAYLWSTAATSSSIIVNSAASYTVTVTNTNACSTTSSGSSITVNANPTASIAVTETSGTANNDGVLCSGASATLDASGSSAGSGTVSGYLWSTAATSSSISVNSAASYTVTVTNTNACSTTSSGSSISVNANPTASIAVTETSGTTNNDGILCSGASATLNASGSTAGSGTVSGYLWSTAATSSSISVNSAASYTVTVTNTNACSTTSSGSSISVNANPTASIAVTETSGTTNNDGILCSGASATLDASGSTAGSGTVSAYLWSTAATSSSISVNSAASYMVTVTNTNACSTTSAGSSIVVNANPTATIVETDATGIANNDGILCSGASALLNASTSTAGSGSISGYLWSTAATSSSISVGSANTYSVIVSNTNGCSTTSANATIVVHANPVATIVETDATGVAINDGIICAGSTALLDASTSTAGSGSISTYLWSTAATSSSVSIGTSGNYTVTVTNSNACYTTSSVSPIVVNTNPVASFTINDNTQCLIGNSFVLTNTSTNGTGAINAWNWTTAGGTNATETGAGPHTTVYAAYGFKTINLSVTDVNNCSNATTFTNNVSVYDHPTAAFVTTESSVTPNDYNVCTGSVVNFTGASSTPGLFSGSNLSSGLAAFQYKVTNLILPGPPAPANAGTGSNASVYSPVVTGTNASVHDDMLYSLLVTNNWGCTNETSGANSRHIYVYPYPVPAISTPDIGAQGQFGTTANNGNGGQLLCHGKVIFNNTSTIPNGSIVSYTWNFGDGSSNSVVSTTDNVKHEFPVNYTMNWFDLGFPNTRYTIGMTAVSNLGCSTSTSIQRDVKNGPDAIIGLTDPTTQALVGNSFFFSNLSQNRHPSFITSSLWNWGDNTTTTSTTFIPKVYTASGDYRVHLITYTNTGCTDTAYLDLSVSPIASASFTHVQNACNSKAVAFTSTSVLASTYLWNFGDGNTSTIANPTHTYLADGAFTVTLTINGGTVSSPTTVHVATTPTVGAIGNSLSACGNVYTFTSATSGYDLGYTWAFTTNAGTGATSTTNTATRSYSVGTSANIALTVTSHGLCATTVNANIPAPSTATIAPAAGVNITALNNCSTTRTVNNTSTNASDYRVSVDGGAYATVTTFPYDITGLSAGSHTLSLEASNGGACPNVATASFFVANVTAAFNSAPAVCGKTVAFSSSTTTSTAGTLSYSWNFNTGEGSSTVANPSFTFANSGSNPVSLSVTSVESGCVSTSNSTTTVSAIAGSNASFTTAVAPGTCDNGRVFTNTSTGSGNTYLWDFGDNTTATNTSPTKHFGSNGNFTVTLTVTNGSCTSTASSVVAVSASTGGSAASFYVVNGASSQPLSTNSFNFFNTSTHSGFGWNTNYSWNFGDGTTNSTNTFIYGKTYAAAGTYTVTLTATSSQGGGCTSTASQTVTVTASAVAAFTYTPNSCGSTSVAFNSSSSVSASTYLWDFGDGSSSTLANPTRTYAAAGSYTVTLTINGNTTSAPQTIIVAATPTAVTITPTLNSCGNTYTFTGAATGAGVTYGWSFANLNGTGATTGAAVTRTYSAAGTDNIVLTASSGLCTATATLNSYAVLQVGTVVNAMLQVTALNACNGTRTINNTGSSSADSFMVSVDGGAYVKKTTFPYDVTGLGAGTHTISLRAHLGTCTDTETSTFVVGSVTAGFTVSSSSCGPTVTFTNTTSTTHGTATYSWNFGVGETSSTSTSPSHTFLSAGTKTVILTATNSNGCVATATNAAVTANAGSGAPSASFTSLMVTGTPCTTGMQFTNTSTGATNWVWNYGDGTVSVPSTTSTILHAYSATGTFTVTLTAYNACGTSAIATANVVVTATGYPVPEVSFNTDNATQCLTGNRFDFFNRTQLNGWGWVPTYSWTFGDGTVDNVNSFVYGKQYAAAGTYTVTLTGTTNMGCTGSSSMTVTVVAPGSCTPGMYRERITGIEHNNGGINSERGNSSTTGVNKNSDISDEVILYPNPNTGEFKLGLKEVKSQSVNITIVDLLGREVYSHQFSLNGSKEIDLYDMNLASGTYNLVLRGDDETVARKQFAVIK